MVKQNEYVIRKFLAKEAGSSPTRDYPDRGIYMTRGSSISSTGDKLYSYSTPIAEWKKDKIMLNENKYSVTTSRQQSDLKRMITEAGIQTGRMKF